MTIDIGSIMSDQENTDERNNEIRNKIFNTTGMKISADDPIVQLIKVQQSFIDTSYALASEELKLIASEVKADIDNHNRNALEMLDSKINDLNNIHSKLQLILDKSQEKKVSYYPIFYIAISILCSSLAAYIVASIFKVQ